MSIESIRISQRAKDHLIKLKRNTGIKYWNELCRWGFCLSLSEPGVPPISKIPSDSNVEMSWSVFGGRYSDLYLSLLKMRLYQDGLPLDEETIAQQFRLHLHRGISYLAGIQQLRTIGDLIRLAYDLAQSNPTPHVNSNKTEQVPVPIVATRAVE